MPSSVGHLDNSDVADVKLLIWDSVYVSTYLVDVIFELRIPKLDGTGIEHVIPSQLPEREGNGVRGASRRTVEVN